MSRYVIPPYDRRFQVIVGWDAPLTTFFAQIFDTIVEAEEDAAACVLWVGDDVQTLTTVAALQERPPGVRHDVPRSRGPAPA